jgi:hypothetical protein
MSATTEDVARPICKCHGEPMIKDGFRRGKQAWQCRIKERARQAVLYADPEWAEEKKAKLRAFWTPERHKERYYGRKERGLCTKCGARPLLSEALCWECLNYYEFRYMLGGV